MPEQTLLTYEDLERFPDDGLRRELLDGELLVSPSPKTRHQEILGRLYLRFGGYVETHGGGKVYLAPLDVVLSNINVLEPDLVFVSDEQLDILTEKNIQGPPVLVIEVLSNPRIDKVRKRDIYARFGVPEYWVVDPDADRIEIYRLEADRYVKPELYEPGDVVASRALPAVQIDLAHLFRR